MKNFTKVLIGVTAVFLAFGAFIIFGPKLVVTDVQQSVVVASERSEAFASIASSVGRGDFGSNQFKRMESNRPEDYAFVTVTVTVRNRGILRADWAQIGLSPIAEDVVMISGEPVDIPPFGSAELVISILSEAKENRDRMVWVDYYLFGQKESASL